MINWRLKSLHGCNIFRYKNINLTFSKESDSYIIVGINLDSEGSDSNGSGKSSIPDIISYAINGATARTVKHEKIYMRGAETPMWTELILTNDDDEDLTIYRTRENGKEILTAKTQYVDLTRRTPRATQREIYKFFGLDPKKGFADFLSSVYFSDTSSKGFLSTDVSPMERQKVLERFLGLSVLDRASELATASHKKLKDELNSYTNSIEAYEVQIKDICVPETVALIAEEQAQNIDCFTEVARYEKIISELTIFSTKLTSAKTTQAKLQTRLLSLEVEKTGLAKEYQEALAQREKGLNVRKEWESKKKRYQEVVGSLPELYKTKSDITSSQTETNNLYEKNAINITTIKEKISSFQSQIAGEIKCPSCDASLLVDGLVITEFLASEKELIVDKIDLLYLDIKAIEKSQDFLSSETDKLCDRSVYIKDNIEKLETEKLELETIRDEAEAVITSDLDAMISKSVSLHSTGLEIHSQLTEVVNVDIPAIICDAQEAGFDLGTVSVSSYKTKIDDLNSKIKTNNELISSNNLLISTHNTINKKIGDLRELQSKLKINIKQASYWITAFIDIKHALLKEFMPMFENSVNTLLDSLGVRERVDFKLSGVTKKGNEKLGFHIRVFDGVHWADFDDYSEGEKSRILICVGFSLRDIASTKISGSLGFLLCDELLDNLDATGMEFFFTLLNKIEGQKLIISHSNLDSISSKCQHKIIVTRKDDVSTCKIT